MAYENQEELLKAIKESNENTSAMAQLAQGQMLQAMRPQKSVVKTNTTNTNTTKPFEYNDIANRRALIGLGRDEYEKALKEREMPWQAFANALSNVKADPTPGGWLASMANGFANAYQYPLQARIDRMKQTYDLNNQEQEKAFQMSQVMGNQTTQNQSSTQNTDYTEMPYGLAGKSGKNDEDKKHDTMAINKAGRSFGYDPVEDMIDFNAADRAAANNEGLKIFGYDVGLGTGSLAKSASGDTSVDLQTIYSDIADNILSEKVLSFIGDAGSVRVADSEEEKKPIFGPFIGYTDMTQEELKAAIDRSRNAYVNLGKKKPAFVKAVSEYVAAMGGDASTPDSALKTFYNSMFTVPKSQEKAGRYNTQNEHVYTKSAAKDMDEWANYMD